MHWVNGGASHLPPRERMAKRFSLDGDWPVVAWGGGWRWASGGEREIVRDRDYEGGRELLRESRGLW